MTDLAKVTEQNFDSEVISSTVPVLVDFYADWCAPCRAMEPSLADIAAEYAGEALVVKLDVDANPETQKKYGVLGLPSLLLFKDGEIVERISGAAPRSRIAAAIEKAIDAQR
jgi:thioredoxin 1